MAWVSPTGFVDPDTQWTDETLIYDENTATYGYDSIAANIWSSYVELTIGSINCDKIRFFADFGLDQIDLIEVDVYYSGVWHNIKSGAFTDSNWEEVSLGGTYAVTAARVKFFNDLGTAVSCKFYEFDFNQVAATGNAIFMGCNF